MAKKISWVRSQKQLQRIADTWHSTLNLNTVNHAVRIDWNIDGSLEIENEEGLVMTYKIQEVQQ